VGTPSQASWRARLQPPAKRQLACCRQSRRCLSVRRLNSGLLIPIALLRFFQLGGSIIFQTYHDPADLPKQFGPPVYAAFDLRAATPDPAEQTQLCEFGAMRHVYRHPKLNPHSWVGFTSINQDKHTTFRFSDLASVKVRLQKADVICWGMHWFSDLTTHRPVSFLELLERLRPGITRVLLELCWRAGVTLPKSFLTSSPTAGHNYFACTNAVFRSYMKWSLPLVEHCLDVRVSGHPADPVRIYLESSPRALSYVAEPLFPIWLALTATRHRRGK